MCVVVVDERRGGSQVTLYTPFQTTGPNYCTVIVGGFVRATAVVKMEVHFPLLKKKIKK